MRSTIILSVLCLLTVSCMPILGDEKKRNAALMKLFLNKYDKNKDGKIEKKEVDETGLRLFAYIDRDCDDILQAGELKVYADEIDGEPTFYDKEKAVKPVETAKMHKYLNIPYAKVNEENSIYCSLDVYKPAKSEKLPVFVFVHGGAWSIGDKSACYYKPDYFIKNNWVYVSVNYRLIPHIEFPENIKDVAKALVWVHDNIKEYGGDAEKIVIMGHSAGAHLVSLIATDDSRLKELKKDLTLIKAVISLDTNGYDIPALTKDRGAMKKLYEGAFGKDKDIQKEASPITHVEKGKNIPPFILLYADNNKKKKASTEAFAQKLKLADVQVDIIAAPSKTHGTINKQFGKEKDRETEEIMKKINKILQETKKEKE